MLETVVVAPFLLYQTRGKTVSEKNTKNSEWTTTICSTTPDALPNRRNKSPFAFTPIVNMNQRGGMSEEIHLAKVMYVVRSRYEVSQNTPKAPKMPLTEASRYGTNLHHALEFDRLQSGVTASSRFHVLSIDRVQPALNSEGKEGGPSLTTALRISSSVFSRHDSVRVVNETYHNNTLSGTVLMLVEPDERLDTFTSTALPSICGDLLIDTNLQTRSSCHQTHHTSCLMAAGSSWHECHEVRIAAMD